MAEFYEFFSFFDLRLDSEGGRASSLEKVEEKPETEAQPADSTNPESTKGKWFSWCPCLSRCC